MSKEKTTMNARFQTLLSRRVAGAAMAAVALLGGLALTASPAAADFGVAPGALTTTLSSAQAGSHVDANTTFTLNKLPSGEIDGDLKDAAVSLPAGLIGNPSAAPRCTMAKVNIGSCPADSMIGEALLTVYFPGLGLLPAPAPVYNVKPPAGVPASFGFFAAGTIPVRLDASVRSDGDYGIDLGTLNASSAVTVASLSTTFWGVPADHNGPGPNFDFQGHSWGGPGAGPRAPFVSAPGDCSAGPLITKFTADAWLNPGGFVTTSTETPEVTGCEKLQFNPSLTVTPDVPRAGAPSGLQVDLQVPQNEDPEGLATPAMKAAVVTLPAGVRVSPSSADGLAGCAPAQIALGTKAVPTCPDASKIATVRIDTPLLEKPMTGSVYLANQGDNPFHSLLALYLVAEGPGVIIKLPGKVVTDPTTGQLTVSFENTPQLPFSDLRLHFLGGPRAAVTMPATCGTYTTHSVLTPWSAPQSGPPATYDSSFTIDQGCGASGRFDPQLRAGTANPVAGSFSPFALQLTRPDGTQEISTITAQLPAGLLARLAGIPYCSDAALAGISGDEGTGEAQLADPSCPAASQIGTVTVGVGASPFYVSTGKAYLAGPYQGAPLSLAAVVPAVAGPFDLGTVVVRNALRVDPATARVTAVSDPLPTILHGIPLDLRDVRVNLDRSRFTVNPTSCEAARIAATIGAVGGATAAPSNRFQVGDCGSLPFHPRIALRVFGKTNRNAKPRLRAVVTARPGEANIARAQVNLPHSEFLEQNHIKTVCTRVQWSAGAGHGTECPQGSIYGYAKAWTPLLDQPLQGPVYLRSSSHKLPDLVAALNGQVDIELAGKVDSGPNRGIRNTFEVVPDAPVSRFMLTMKGGRKGLLVNSENLCRKGAKTRAIVRFTGQNGKVEHFKPKVRNSCRAHGSKRHRKEGGHHRQASPHRGGRGGR